MAVINNKFKLYAPINNKDIETSTGGGQFHIEGIANSGLEDLVGDIVTTDALKSITEQATNINLHYNHNTGKDDIIGTIVDSKLLDEGAWIKASIIDEQKDWLQSYLQQGIKFGFSISGTCDYEDGSYSNIVDWQLTEISLTDIPCDPHTMGTVSMSKSFDNIVLAIKEQKQDNEMEEHSMAEEEPKYITEEDAIGIVNDAFNEKKEEFLETIRDELKSEYEAEINAIKEQIDALKPSEEEPEPVPAEGEEGKATDEEEEKSTDNEKSEEEKTYTQEDVDKMVADQLDKAVNEKVKNIFDEVGRKASFEYDEHKGADKESVENKTYTAKELAEMGVI